MTDNENFIHPSRAEFKPQRHAPDCPDPSAELEIGYGLAGGGFGAYGFCPHCCAVIWKEEDQT